MLQQTTVAAVTPLYERWMERFPEPRDLAQAELDEVMVYWSGLGYYQRARRLWMACREIAESSHFPNTFVELMELPGLGPYTSAAVASIAFGRPELAIDTNVIRVLYRFFGWKRKRYDLATHRRLRRELRPILSNLDPGMFNQALMELGGKVCAPKSPNCSACPLAEGCRAKALELQGEIPIAEVKKAKKKTPGQALLVRCNDLILLTKGTSLGLLSELWQPPIVFQEISELSNFHGKLLQSMRTWVHQAEQVSQIRYGISGRLLELEVIWWASIDLSVKSKLETLAADFEQEILWMNLNDSNSGTVGLSSLTRKLLQSRSENP